MSNSRMRQLLLVLLCSLILAGQSFASATITIVNGNAAGVGFNDPTPAAPVGGNPGTTIGQQRLLAFQRAAEIWGATLDSKVEIRVLATFEPLSCTATAATLGSAGTRTIWANFPGAEFLNTWYHSALANKLAGADLNPPPDPFESDIRARFNSNLGNPGCLTGTGWYYGFDRNHGNQIDLVTVLLHEFAHGLGFSQFASVTTGAQIPAEANGPGLPDVYNRQLLDTTSGKTWDIMTDAERVASAINPRKVVWTGRKVTNAVPLVLSLGVPLLRVNSPAAIAGTYDVGTASFGPAVNADITGQVVIAQDAADAAGPSTTDGCSAITNSIAGKIALLDRGTCTFTVKVKNAQNAGAIAVLIADNAVGAPPAGLGGSDPTITIPSVRITQSDGNLIRAQVANGVNATLGLDITRRAGADGFGRALLYTPNPVQPGSTISHWDTIAFPNQLMEPAINADLTHSVDVNQDMTLPLLRDVGWYPDRDLDLVSDELDACLGSDLSPQVAVGGINTGIANVLFTNGCTISDLVRNCRSGNHGSYSSCSAHLGAALVSAGIITGAEKGKLDSAVARDK